MGKTKTSKKQKNSSADSARVVTLKKGVATSAWHPTEELLDEKKLAQSLFQCLKDGDSEAFKEILFAHLDAKVKTKLAKEKGVSARTMYAALSESGNPSLNTIAKLVQLACA